MVSQRTNSSSKRISRPSGMRPTGEQPCTASHATVKSYFASSRSARNCTPKNAPSYWPSRRAKNPVKAFGLSQSSPTRDFIARYRWYRSNVLDHGCPPLTFLEPQDAPCGLLSRCSGLTRFQEPQEMDLIGFIRGQVNYQDYQRFESMAPTHYQLPDGSRKPLTYHEDGRVSLSCRFERLFGLDEAPAIAGRNILLYLLAPNMRPVQTTQDLPNFWRETYPSVRKELRGRYPKHPWPEDPLTAPPGIHRSRNKKRAPR